MNLFILLMPFLFLQAEDENDLNLPDHIIGEWRLLAHTNQNGDTILSKKFEEYWRYDQWGDSAICFYRSDFAIDPFDFKEVLIMIYDPLCAIIDSTKPPEYMTNEFDCNYKEIAVNDNILTIVNDQNEKIVLERSNHFWKE